MAHESWWVREFQLLPLHNPLLTFCKFFLTICLCFRFQPVKLVLELIFEAVRTLVRIVVLLQQLIRDLHQIISMAHDGWESISTSSSPISHYWRSVNFTVILTILFFFLQISASCVNPRANCWCDWVLCQPRWSTPTTDRHVQSDLVHLYCKTTCCRCQWPPELSPTYWCWGIEHLKSSISRRPILYV